MPGIDYMQLFYQLMRAMQQQQGGQGQRWGGQAPAPRRPMYGGAGMARFSPSHRQPMGGRQRLPGWGTGGEMGYADRAGEQERLRRMSDEAMGRTPAPPTGPMYWGGGGGAGWTQPFMGGGSGGIRSNPYAWAPSTGPMYGDSSGGWGMRPGVSSLDPSGEHQRLLDMSNAGPLPPPFAPTGQEWVNPSAFAGWSPSAKGMYGDSSGGWGMRPGVSSLDPSGEHQRLLDMSNTGSLPPPPPPTGQESVPPLLGAKWGDTSWQLPPGAFGEVGENEMRNF